VKDIVRRGRLYSFNRGQLSSPGQRFVDYLKFPGKERLELGKDGKLVYLNDNDQGWELDKQGIREQTPEQIERFQENNRHDFEYLLRFRGRGEDMAIYYLGREFADNRRVDVLELVDEGGDSVKLLVDARNYLPMQLQYREQDPLSKEWIDITEYFGKFVKVQGIPTAMQFTRERAGLRSLEVHFREVEYNAGLSDELFTLPALEAHWKKVK
jgi:outer membrane lipoprotein-sorting protein